MYYNLQYLVSLANIYVFVFLYWILISDFVLVCDWFAFPVTIIIWLSSLRFFLNAKSEFQF